MFSKYSVFENTEVSDLYALKDISNYHGSILSYDIDTNTPVQSCVSTLQRSTYKVQLYRIRLYNKCFLYCTNDTEFLDSNYNWIKLSQLNQFDEVLCLDQSNNTVAEITEEMMDYAYTLVTQKGNAFLNNILVRSSETE